MKAAEEDLHDQGEALTARLTSMANRLTQTAMELEVLADRLRRRDDHGDTVREPKP